MCKSTIRAIASALSIIALFTAGSAAADYSVVSTWSDKYKALSKPTELAGSGVQTLQKTYGIDIPDTFTFRFYGEQLKYLNVSGQGAISFSANEYISPYPTSLPNGGPQGIIAPFEAYFARNYASSDPFDGGIFYKIDGSGSNEVLKVEWLEMGIYYCYGYQQGPPFGCDISQHYSMQAWIYESDGVNDSLIQFHYSPVHNPNGPANYYDYYYNQVYNYNYQYAPWILQGMVGVSNRARTQGTYGLACKADCRKKDWPENTVMLFGQPANADLLGTIVSLSTTLDPVNVTLNTKTDVRNIGAQAAIGTNLAYYLSADNILDAKDTKFAEHPNTFDVASGATSTITDTFVVNRPKPGWYYYCLKVDSNDALTEVFEDNNTRCTDNHYIIGVDFDGTIVVPGTAGPGDDMLTSFTVSNLGGEATDVNFKIVLAKAQKPAADGSDIVLYDTRTQGGAVHLDAGGSYVQNQIPLFIPGDALDSHENEVTRYVLMQFDPDGEINEADETNNVKVSSPVVLIKPDLRVDDVQLTLPDGACYFGRPISVDMTISNLGAARARIYDNALVISDNGVITSYDTPVRLSPAFCNADEDCAGTLGADASCDTGAHSCTKPCVDDGACTNDLGESEGLTCLKASGAAPEDEGLCRNVLNGYDTTTIKFSGTIPETDANGQPLYDQEGGGTFYFGAVSDFYDVINEGNETNNARPANSGMECHKPAPDYVATSLQLPTNAAAGEQMVVHYVVANRGNLDGTATWRYVLSSNEIISTNDIALQFADPTAGSLAIEADKSYEGTDIVLLPSSLVAGKYFLGIVLDPNNQDQEILETNNVLVAGNQVDVKASALHIATSALPPATVEVTYVRQLVATGGAGEYKWTASPSMPLPGGMRLSTSGELTGKPQEPGNNVFGVKVQSGGSTAEGLLFMAVLPATGPLTVSTDRLPSAYVDVTYRVELAAVGGIPPYSWTIIGRPPQGISLKNNTLTGIPEIPDGSGDATTFKVQVRDSRGTTSERELALPVLESADLSIQTTRIQDGLVGQPYQQIIRAAGGQPPYDFTITGLQGTGLAPNSNSETTALISGIPESAGYFEMTVVVKDQTQQQATQRFKFAVSGQAIQVQTDRALPLALPGKAYPETQLVSGSTAVKWEIYSGEMPAGVVLSEDGMLSGTVEASARPRTYTFLVRAYDDKGGEGYGSFSILLQAKKLPLVYKTTKTGCGSNAAGGSPSAFLLPVLGAAFMLLRRRRS